MYRDKTILITGGTGSFGKTIVRKFLAEGCGDIRVFSRDEKKQEDMRLATADDRLKFFIGDVRDRDSLDRAMTGVDYVFHAAALKQVPSCEFHPMEAVRTNVLGTENVMQSSVANKVSKVVVLSTDKAVYPINAMGISKAMAEKLVCAHTRLVDEGETVICATRYGNVMASRGSVIPLFIDQIKAGKPLTLTDPDMTRFLMSLDESVELVMHAFSNAKQGDIFAQKSPAATVGVLAKALLELFNADNDLKIIGTRHGEKLYETLVSREEMARVDDMGKYYRVPADSRDLNYGKYFTDGQREISDLSDYTSHNTDRLEIEDVKNKLLQLDLVRNEINA